MANTNSNSNSNRRYSFFNVVNAVGKDNKNFLSLTTVGYVSNFQTREIKGGYDPNNKGNGGHTILAGSMPLNNRVKAINRLLNSNFDEGKESVWLTVQMWDERAERFQKMITSFNNPKNFQLVLCGSLSLNTYNKKDGTEGKNLILNVQDWHVISASANEGGTNSGNTNSASNESAAASAPVKNTPSFDNEGFLNEDAFEDVSVDDLPF